MNLMPIRAEVYVDYDDISLVIQRPDAKLVRSQLDENLYKKTSEIIEKAQSKGVYYDVSGRDGGVRSLLIMKSGIVIGINNNPETIMKRYKAEARAKKTADGKSSQRRK